MSKRTIRYKKKIRIPKNKIRIKTRRSSRRRRRSRRRRSSRRRRPNHPQVIIQLLLSAPPQSRKQSNIIQALKFSRASSQALKMGNIKKAFTLAVISRTLMDS